MIIICLEASSSRADIGLGDSLMSDVWRTYFYSFFGPKHFLESTCNAPELHHMHAGRIGDPKHLFLKSVCPQAGQPSNCMARCGERPENSNK